MTSFRRPRASRRQPAACAIVLVAVCGAATAAATDGALRVPPDDPPPALASLVALDALENALAVTLSDDGRLAAAAFPHPRKTKASLVRTTSDAGVREFELRGSVRALRFDSTGATLFAIAFRDGNQAPVDAWLALLDLRTGRSLRVVTLPTTARGLGEWASGAALLVACRDEVRTVVLPEARTGPLFWIGGDNLAVDALPGGDLALVGQEGRIVLVNLSDPQGRNQLPIRESVAAPGGVAQLAVAPDGGAAIARFSDGTTQLVRLDPLRLERLEGTSSFVAWPGPRTPAAPSATASAAPAEIPGPAVAAAIPETGSAPAPSPADSAAPSPESLETAPASPTLSETGATPHDPEAAPEPETTIPAREEPPPPAPPESDASMGRSEPTTDTGSLEGRVTGPAAGAVVEVVLLGPDNILREARRVTLDPDGIWEATDLAPGSYRVMLDGGGGVVVVSSPPFRQTAVTAGIRVRVEPIEAVRTLAK
jgi:hypothetical protein